VPQGRNFPKESLGLEPKIIKYKENLPEQEAFDLEKKLIRLNCWNRGKSKREEISHCVVCGKEIYRYTYSGKCRSCARLRKE